MRSCPKCSSIYSTGVEHCGIDGERLVVTDRDPLIGTTLDRYQVIEKLGQGGMGRVYRAQHVFLRSEVALKVLFGEIAADTVMAARFRREALAAHAIKHPNVAAALDFGVTAGGLTFMVMELVRGSPLSEELRRGRVMTIERAARVIGQIAAGLSSAHALGFVHRDLKPANVMLAREDGAEIVKILDFGLVAVKDPEPGEHGQLTTNRHIFGTPTYMAPEQIRAEPVSPATDLYALGVILYELLAGHPPFKGEAMFVYSQHVRDRPPPLAPARGLERLALALLEKNPARRPQSALDVLKAIEDCGFESTRHAPRRESQAAPAFFAPESPEPRRDDTNRDQSPSKSIRRELAPPPIRWWPWAIGAAACVAVALGAGYVILRGDRSEEPVVILARVDPPAGGRAERAAREDRPAEKAAEQAEGREEKEPDTAPSGAPGREASREAEPEPSKRTAFDLLDAELRAQLQKRRLTFADLGKIAPGAAARWAAWRRATNVSTAEARRTLYDILAELPPDRLDRAYLEGRVRRLRRLLEDTPESERGPSFEAAQEAYIRLTLSARKAADEAALDALAKEVDRVEAQLSKK